MKGLPGFRFKEFPNGKPTRLPDVKVRFGLDLSGSSVVDAGLKEFATLEQLITLSLYGTQVTDAGIKELATLKQLTTLNLSDTKVTDAGAMELREALPKCMIIK